MSSIADFLIEIGFNTDAIKGIKKIEKAFDDLEKKTKKVNSEEYKSNKRKGKEVQARVKAEKAEAMQAQRNLQQRLADYKKSKAETLKQDQNTIKRQKSLQDAADKARTRAIQQRVRYTDKLKNLREGAVGSVTSSAGFSKLSSSSQAAIRQQLAEVKNTRDVQRIRQKISVDARLQTAQLKKQNFLMERQVSSAKQLAGNMVSAFAVVGAGVGVTNIGMDFESINAGMLAASSSSKEAGTNLKFVKDESVRLGLSLKETAKGYTRLLASNQGQLSQSEIETLFSGVSEASTVLGLSADDQIGTIRA